MWRKSTPTWLQKEYDELQRVYWREMFIAGAVTANHATRKKNYNTMNKILLTGEGIRRHGVDLSYQQRLKKLMERISKDYKDVFGSKSQKLTAAYARKLVPKAGSMTMIDAVHITYTELRTIVTRGRTTTLTLKRPIDDPGTVYVYSGKKLIHTIEEEDSGELYVKLWANVLKMITHGRFFATGPFVIIE